MIALLFTFTFMHLARLVFKGLDLFYLNVLCLKLFLILILLIQYLSYFYFTYPRTWITLLILISFQLSHLNFFLKAEWNLVLLKYL